MRCRRVASPPPSDLPAPRSLVRLEDSRPILRRILTETICDFWYPATIDTEHGGYGCNVDHAGRWSGATSRYLIGQARTLWFFSHLLRSGHGDARHRDAARHGFAFLRDRMWDPDHGGFYWQVDAADGTVAKPDKQICGQSFALYALAEYALATGDDAARALVGDLFGLIDAEAHDPEQPGYFEMLTQDWSRVPDWNYMDRNPRHKTINTHLHLMEAFSTFYALTGDDLVRARLMELIHIQRDLVFRPEYDACSDSHLRDWTPVRRRWDSSVSYGHDLESIWLLADAREAIGEPVAPDLDTCRRIFASSLRHGFDRKRGGFYFLGPYKRPALHRQKIWWVQAESLVAGGGQRAELHDPLVVLAHDAGQTVQHQQGGRAVALQEVEEGLVPEHRHGAGFRRDHGGRARPAVDRGELAEGVAGLHGREGDLAAGQAEVDDVGSAFGDEEDVARVLAALEDPLAGAIAAPAAAGLKMLELARVQPLEQPNAC